ncbi:MAG: TolC family protein [Phycisphaerae bacterium]|nr:TolC family protein [Phycisphaerae bacterium]MDW8261750.1 TolC family protein [Phycisphaerales bacterium]
MKRLLAAGLVAVLSLGCAPDNFRRDADAQVQRLLKDRTQRTLGYTPRTTLDTPDVAPPTRRSFESIPATPLPPPSQAALEPMRLERSYCRLGPEKLFDDAQPTLQTEELGVSSALQGARLRLRLGPPPPQDLSGTTLELFGALRYAIENSRSYRARQEDLYLAALRVTLQRHLFDPIPFAQSSFVFSGNQTPDRMNDAGQVIDRGYDAALRAVQTLGVRQQLPYGGSLTARAVATFVSALSDGVESGEDASIVLEGTIPLLRGAGMVNLEPLIDSERGLVYAVRDFEEFRRAFVVEVASAYFSLINAQNRINNNYVRYVNAVNLVVRLEALYAAGLQNFLQVQQARQQRLSAENTLVNSQQQFQNQLDTFKLLIGMPVDEPLAVVGVALEVPVPDLRETDFVALAEKHRLALQTARDQIEDARRAVAHASNRLLPELNLSASATIGNRAGSPARAIDRQTLTYSAGASLDWPLDRLAERNEYRIALIDFQRAQRALVTTRDTVAAAVRRAARAVESARITLDLQRRSIELARRRLEYSNELLIQGQAQARDVTEAQNALLDAQNNFDQARADLQIQILSLLRDTGTLRVDPSAGTLGSILDGPSQPEPTRQRIESDFRVVPDSRIPGSGG